MARPLRIEDPGAIHHVMSRGNLGLSVFDDECDYQRLLQGLEQAVGLFGWDMLSFVLMPNHFHLLLHEFRGRRTQLLRNWSLLDLGQAAYDLARSVDSSASSERSHRFAGKIRSGRSQEGRQRLRSADWRGGCCS